MQELLEICGGLLKGKCVRYRDALICNNNTIKIVDFGEFARVSVNLAYISIPKTVKERVDKMEKLNRLPCMEITMLQDEAEIIGVWLALAALGQESPRPDDLLCWPSGDYAWTLRAAAIGKPERRFG